ncbi:MAG TPA: competence protein CoiA family protein [Gemmatimonadaceae bacterium]|nr:competence protein CoiA family protein [Gemmatimonadaceae bacterium]
MESAGLTWVIAAGVPTHVSSFAGLAPRERPRVVCPQCGGRLTLKLGRILRHHAAHSARAACPATQPETALHLDLKFHIAARLREASSQSAALVVRRRCAGVGSEACDLGHEETWTSAWDDVVVETRVGVATPLRPDILLQRAGHAIGAIEIRVSHAVDERKAAALDGAGVPWIEVRGDAAMLAGASEWSADRPLPIASEGGGDATGAWGPWRCPRHAAAHTAWVGQAAARHAADAEAGRHRVVLRAARVVDVFHPDGTRDRAIYRIERHYVDGRLDALVLRNGTREIARHSAGESHHFARSARAALGDGYAADVARLAADDGFTDSPMRWATGDAAGNLVHEALDDLTPGDPTPLATRYPRRWFYDRERGQWFLPAEMRAVRWDRGDPDAFAAHPAWAESRRKVRERPARESSWGSFVFASRPTALSFPELVRIAENMSLLDVDGPPGRRALVLLTAAVTDDVVRRIARWLADSGCEHVWLSHPMDWTSARADLAWAPAGRDGRGRGVVVVDGVGVYRADQFVRVFGRGDRRLSAEAIKARSAARVAGLAQR